MGHSVWRINMWNVALCSDLYGKWEVGSGLPFLCKTWIPDCWLSDKIQWYHEGTSGQRKYKVSTWISSEGIFLLKKHFPHLFLKKKFFQEVSYFLRVLFAELGEKKF